MFDELFFWVDLLFFFGGGGGYIEIDKKGGNL